ncbi:MAG TPA: protease inhibitor I42 family protein [Hyphomonadaceae bacterium]|jgi:inhibitor of cysteine peptidase|nr:protease inhibitor I42 family protein [Hyphomonadaceae bacterium]
MIEMSVNNSGQTQAVPLGEEILVRLPENPTTGYQWQVSFSGSGEVASIGDSFEAGTASSAPGAAGHRILRFKATRPGAVKLALVERRAWEAAAIGAKTWEAQIIVS